MAYNINVDQARRYPATLVDGDTLTIDLKEQGEVARKQCPKREASGSQPTRITSLPMTMGDSARADA